MGSGADMVRIDRKSSIEKEPRTLNIRQMQFARDAALYVVNTRTNEEALQIFTEGLEPVATVSEHNERTMEDIGEEFDCLANGIRVPEPRDIASAPF